MLNRMAAISSSKVAQYIHACYNHLQVIIVLFLFDKYIFASEVRIWKSSIIQ